jgi:thiol:disulfide interchange protein
VKILRLFKRPQIRLATLLLVMVPLGLLFLGVRYWWQSRPIEWKDYSQALVEQELDEGRIVVVHFTAQWDMTSAWNGVILSHSPELRRYSHTHSTTFVMADWTEESDEIRDALYEQKLRSIPATFIYDPRHPQQPRVLTDIVTPEQLLENLQVLNQ